MKNNMIKSLIFDLDGTLADTIGDVAYIGNLALEAFSLGEIPTEKYKSFVGDGAKKLCERMLSYHGIINDDKTEKLLGKYLSVYDENEGKHIKEYVGMKETLDILSKKGVRFFVISNKPCKNVVSALKLLYPDIYFEKIIGGDSGFPMKPDVTSLEYILKEFSLKKEEVAYIGDGDADVKLSQNTEVFGIGCLWGYRKKEELEALGATVFAKIPQDIIRIIEKA